MLTFVPDFEIQQPIISPGLKAVPYFSFFAFSTLLPVEQRPKEFKCSPRPKDILFFIADCKGLKTVNCRKIINAILDCLVGSNDYRLGTVNCFE